MDLVVVVDLSMYDMCLCSSSSLQHLVLCCYGFRVLVVFRKKTVVTVLDFDEWVSLPLCQVWATAVATRVVF